MGSRQGVLVRAAGVSRGQRPGARGRTRALRALSRSARGPAGEDPLARGLACELRGGLPRARLGSRLIDRGEGIVPPEELDRLSRNRNVLAALLEAALAALFLEHGFEPIEEAIVEAFAGRIEYAATTHVDYKTELQEQLAALGQQVSYSVLEVEGPPHDRKFTSAAVIDGDQAGVGVGASKKAAEQEAAKQALEKVRAA